jgi:hypothetical protein
MKLSEDNVDKIDGDARKSEITARQYKEHLKIKKAIKKQEKWRYLIED